MVQAMTLIKKVYEEELKPMGYVKVKSKYPYFAKMLTPEIFAVIALEKKKYCSISRYENAANGFRECGEFSVYCGIGTVYKKNIDFNKDVEDNKRWLLWVRDIYHEDNIERFDEVNRELTSFLYTKDDKTLIISAAKNSIEKIKRYTFDKFDEIDSLEKALKYLEKYNSKLLHMCEFWNEEFDYCKDVDEGMLYIITNNHDDLEKWYERKCKKEYYRAISTKNGFTMEDCKEECAVIGERREKRVHNRDEIFGDASLYDAVMREIQRRKIQNIERLKSFGIEI